MRPTVTLLHCTDEDRRIIAEALKAAVEGPFFPDEEFHSIFGLERAEVAEVSRSWPNVDEADDRVGIAVNNTLVNLTGYPHKKEKDWDRFLSVPESWLLEVLGRWRLPRGTNP
jgi:hypothetical protein